MTYQVLARKWRPQDFSGLIGQEPIVTALRNALRERRIAQAYLFSGIRGVGKTTAARVLAKALNCERGDDGPRPDPCNECGACLETTTGSGLDVLEVDAATYSKVEQVRELTDSLRYGPSRGHYKVVVLDEVHRLSRQAFDALLKIVEEPPEHLVFIFATTEINAVPATLLSRCQEFQFRRVSAPVLTAHLRTICDAEAITASDTALRLIARAGEGSVRDAVALLDQLATYGNGEIDDNDASRLLGGLDAGVFHRALAAILAGDHATIVALASEVESNGWDPANVYSQFLAYVRDAIHLSLGGDRGAIELPAEAAEELATLVASRGYENLLRLAQLLLASEQMVRSSEVALLALEIAWLRAAELPKVTRLEDVLAGRAELPDVTTTPPPSGVPSASPSSPPPTPPSAPPSTPPATPTASSAEARSAEAPPNRSSTTLAAPLTEADLDAFHAALDQRRRPLAAQIRRDQLRFAGDELLIRGQPGDRLLPNALERNRAFLDELIGDTLPARISWRFVAVPAAAVESTASEPDEKPAKRPPAATEKPAERPAQLRPVPSSEVEQHPTVQAVLSILGGDIQNVRPAAEADGDLGDPPS